MEKEQTQNSNDFFRQAIKVALIEFKEKEPDSFIKLFNTLPENNYTEKIGWLFTDKTSFNVFYNLLKEHECISCDFELFRNHFKAETEKPKSKIIWKANLNELVYLFSRLREEGAIKLCKNQHQLLQSHFLDKYEKPLKAGCLRTSLEKGIRNNYRMEVINSIIKDVLWQMNN